MQTPEARNTHFHIQVGTKPLSMICVTTHKYVPFCAQHSAVSRQHQLTTSDLVKDNGSLDGTLVAHALEALFPLFELEGLVDDTLDLDLARIEIVDSSRD